MEKNNLPTDNESIKTIELEPGQSLRIKIIGEEETRHEVIIEPEALKVIYGWIGENYLEHRINCMASSVCFFADKAMEEITEAQPTIFESIQAISRIHQDLIKFLR